MNHFSQLDIESPDLHIRDDSQRTHHSSSLRVLVVMACFGSKNLHLLKQQIASYQRMGFDIDVVVASNDEKDLGPGVESVVGLPSADPWSLPFAHKNIFSQRIDQYDLFIYSEDDIGVTESNIRAFINLSPHLCQDEVAGFIRYEVGKNGEHYFPDIFGQYHWNPTSVEKRGPHTIAQLTNEHAAFYILTKSQLRKAIASGGFLKAPYDGLYDMPCTAATDPYTSCGLRKVVCISSLNDFSVHHLSNRYAGIMGVAAATVHKQVDALLKIANRLKPAAELFEALPTLRMGDWGKNYYEPVNPRIIEAIPAAKSRVLSIGVGWGATERVLVERGANVTALPLDAVMGSLLVNTGMEIVEGDIEQCLQKLRGRTFDYIIIGDLLHLISQPSAVLQRAAKLIGAEGILLAYGPNFSTLRTKFKQALGMLGWRRFKNFSESKIQEISPLYVKRALRRAGLKQFELHWISQAASDSNSGPSKIGFLYADRWCLRARAGQRVATRKELFSGLGAQKTEAR